jgi:hypothetical protein
MNATSHEQYLFRDGSLTGVYMGNEPDISNFIYGYVGSHGHRGLMLSPVMDKRTVGFGHPVQLILSADCRSFTPGGFHELLSQPGTHGHTFTGPSAANQPPHSQRLALLAAQFRGDLVSGPTNPLGPYLYRRGRVPYSLLEHFKWFSVRLVADNIKGVIDYPLGGGLFAPLHHSIDEPRQLQIVIFRVRWHYPEFRAPSSRHKSLHLTKICRRGGESNAAK